MSVSFKTKAGFLLREESVCDEGNSGLLQLLEVTVLEYIAQVH